MNSTKTLYFENAGAFHRPEEYGDLNGCRIRTAFSLTNGKRVYFEACRWTPSKIQVDARKKHPELPPLELGKSYATIDCVFEITDEIDERGFNKDDCNESRIKYPYKKAVEWTRAAVLEFVNSLGADFSAVEVLPNLAGYCVHASNYTSHDGNTKNYNYGDEFEYNAEQTARRIAKRNEIEEIDRAKTGERFPAFSFWVDDTDPNYCNYSAPYAGIPQEERRKRYYIPA